MKRFTIMLLVLALCGSFTACSDEKAESGKNEDNTAVGVVTPGQDTANAAKPADSEKRPDMTSGEDKPSDQKPSQSTTGGTASDKTQEPQTQTGSSASNQPTQSQPQGTASVQSHPNHSQTVTTSTPEPETIPEAQPIPDYEVTPDPQPAPAPQPAPEPEPQPAPEPAAPTLEQASGYVGSSASALESALGSPVSKEYSPSCMGEGEDGMWVYAGFTVYTYRENGVETVEAVR